MFFNTFVVRGEQLSGLSLPINTHCFLLPILTVNIIRLLVEILGFVVVISVGSRKIFC